MPQRSTATAPINTMCASTAVACSDSTASARPRRTSASTEYSLSGSATLPVDPRLEVLVVALERAPATVGLADALAVAAHGEQSLEGRELLAHVQDPAGHA